MTTTKTAIQAVATSGSNSSSYTFAATSGYRNDGDAGLTHVGARYYDAQVGRFVTRDTELDQHPYLYCGHDPVNALDPSGHLTKGQKWGLAVFAAVSVVVTVATGGITSPVLVGVISVGTGVAAGAIGGAVQSGVDHDHNMLGDIFDGMIDGGVGGAITGGLATGPIGKPVVMWIRSLLKL